MSTLMLANYSTKPKLCLRQMRQREFRIPSPCETLAFIKLTWLPQSRGSQYPPVPLLVSSVHHASCYLFHPLLALHSARIITNDNGVTRPDTSLFSTLSSCTGVRLSFLCARLFLLSVSLFVGANGDKETDCPAFLCRGERRADQHGTNCFPPSPVNYVRYAFIIKVYQLGGKMTLSDELPHRFIRQTAGAEHAHVPETLIKRPVPGLHPPAANHGLAGWDIALATDCLA